MSKPKRPSKRFPRERLSFNKIQYRPDPWNIPCARTYAEIGIKEVSHRVRWAPHAWTKLTRGWRGFRIGSNRVGYLNSFCSVCEWAGSSDCPEAEDEISGARLLFLLLLLLGESLCCEDWCGDP